MIYIERQQRGIQITSDESNALRYIQDQTVIVLATAVELVCLLLE